MSAASQPFSSLAAPAIWFCSATAALAHGRGYALGDAASPAARGMALAMLGLVLFVISGIAGLVLYLRYKAAHPSPVQSMLDTLATQEPLDAGASETSAEHNPTAHETWTKSADWWKSGPSA